MRFVLDASFAMTWVLESERTPATLKHYEALSREESEALVPALWAEEIANVFLTLQRGRKLTAAQATVWLDLFRNLPIKMEEPSMEESFGEVRLLALDHGLSAYDARYLHLAMREGLPLATRDKQLTAAAPKAGINIL